MIEMTKQSQQEQQPEVDLDITPKTLLRQYELLDTFLENLRKNNKENGLNSERTHQYVPSIELTTKKKISKFIRQATNKNGKWNTVESLSNIISDSEKSQYEESYPIFQLSRLTRVRVGDKEFLHRIIKITGLDRGGNIITTSFNGLDSWTKPTVSWDYIPINPDTTNPNIRSSGDDDDEENNIRVARIRYDNNGGEPIGKKVYLQSYSAEKVQKILEQTPPVGNYEDKISGTGLCFHNTSETSPVISINSISEFTTPDFIGLFKEKRTPAPQINVSSKAILADFVKGSELKQYQ